ncbi:hypothetical protein R3P38DRAFT_3494666 [Favolaschia claudopus]|uniref:Uncharacterized protein n=1 Tax=Favolaschia claudopus TaxID=2862362 RepID=A0AAV9Z671_9AGAR
MRTYQAWSAEKKKTTVKGKHTGHLMSFFRLNIPLTQGLHPVPDGNRKGQAGRHLMPGEHLGRDKIVGDRDTDWGKTIPSSEQSWSSGRMAEEVGRQGQVQRAANRLSYSTFQPSLLPYTATNMDSTSSPPRHPSHGTEHRSPGRFPNSRDKAACARFRLARKRRTSASQSLPASGFTCERQLWHEMHSLRLYRKNPSLSTAGYSEVAGAPRKHEAESKGRNSLHRCYETGQG